jgi:hypothetical protein
MACKHNDCGWCYAPSHVRTNARAGACVDPDFCDGRVPIHWPEPTLPPINLYVVVPAANFYPDATYIHSEGDDQEEHY